MCDLKECCGAPSSTCTSLGVRRFAPGVLGLWSGCCTQRSDSFLQHVAYALGNLSDTRTALYVMAMSNGLLDLLTMSIIY